MVSENPAEQGQDKRPYMELQTQLAISRRLGFLNSPEFEKAKGLAPEVGRMLTASLSKLRTVPNL